MPDEGRPEGLSEEELRAARDYGIFLGNGFDRPAVREFVARMVATIDALTERVERAEASRASLVGKARKRWHKIRQLEAACHGERMAREEAEYDAHSWWTEARVHAEALAAERTENRRLHAAVESLGGEFDPESIRWDGQPPAEWEGNGPCQECHQPTPPWHAPDELWDRVMGAPDGTGGVVCPSCFARLATERGVITDPAWEVIPSAALAAEREKNAALESALRKGWTWEQFQFSLRGEPDA